MTSCSDLPIVPSVFEPHVQGVQGNVRDPGHRTNQEAR